jgi:hypothetical protein
MNAGMLSAHVLLMGGSEGPTRHLSMQRHLSYHAHGHGFDVVHVGGGLAAVEIVLCLYVLTTRSLGRVPTLHPPGLGDHSAAGLEP